MLKLLMEPKQDKRTWSAFGVHCFTVHCVCKEMFLYTSGLKECAVWNWMLQKESENQFYSHTSPHYDRTALQKAICSKLLNKAATLKPHHCRKSEETHMHARVQERLIF